MAEFNPQVPSPEPKNFGGYSQGIAANKTFSTLFSGLSGLVEGGAQGADRLVQQNIREDAGKKVEEVRTLFGVDAVTDAAASTVPSEIANGRAYAEKLKTAYASGTIRESYYYGQLQSKVKELRSKYPGYEEQVDNIISDITGVTPANAVIAALRAEAAADKESADSETKFQRSWEATNQAEIQTAYPDYFTGGKDKYSFAEVQASVAQIQADRESINADNSKIARDIAAGNLRDNKVMEAASREVSVTTNNLLSGVINAYGESYPKFMEKLRKLSGPGAKPTPEELNELKQGFVTMREAATQQTLRMMNRPLNSKGDSYATYLTPDQQKNLIASATSPIDTMLDNITNGNYGLVGGDAAFIKATADREQRNILENYGVAAKLQAAKEILGPEAFGVMLSQNPKLMSEFSTTMSNYAISNAAVGDKGASQTFSELQNAEDVSPEAYNQVIDTVTSWITSSDPKKGDIDQKAVNFLFGPGQQDFLSLFNKKEQIGIYSRLVNSQISASLKKNSSPEAWQSYSRWAYNNFYALFKGEADTIKENMGMRKFIDVKWDPNIGQFRLKNNYSPNDVSMFSISDAAEIDATKSAVAAINRMNVALSSVGSVMKADGQDMTEQMDVLMKTMMMDDPNAKGSGNLLDKLQGAVKQGLDWLKGPSEKAPNESGSPDDRSSVNPVNLLTPENSRAEAVRTAASSLGIAPEDLAMVMGYETIGTFDPDIVGGTGGNYQGLIQFGPEERETYGYKKGMSFEEQVTGPVVRYLKDRGIEPGMEALDLYSTINAGSPGLYEASDRKGWDVRRHVSEMEKNKDKYLKALGI